MFDAGFRRYPREENNNPVFLPGESHGQRETGGQQWETGPWGCKELDTTELLNNNESC